MYNLMTQEALGLYRKATINGTVHNGLHQINSIKRRGLEACFYCFVYIEIYKHSLSTYSLQKYQKMSVNTLVVSFLFDAKDSSSKSVKIHYTLCRICVQQFAMIKVKGEL